MKECSLCGRQENSFHRKYKGKKYCSNCYAYLFKSKICSDCGNLKRIYRYNDPPICRQCETKDTPCIRCHKTEYSIGKVTESGPVCNSCSIYFRPIKTCTICHKSSRHVSRRLKYGENDPICEKCFNKKHYKTCSHCRQRSAPFFYDLDRNVFCKPCSTKPDKKCITCGLILPAGHHGRKCSECFGEISLQRRLKINIAGLDPVVAAIYADYSSWLAKKKGAQHAARIVDTDYEIFTFLSDWISEHNQLPSYQDYIQGLTVQKSRKHLVCTRFLNKEKIFQIDDKLKAEIGDLDTIDRIMTRLDTQSTLYPFLEGYHHKLQEKYLNGKTTPRSFRLALTPAVTMLNLGEYQKKKIPDNQLIKQYLWLHYGQRAAITGFINFLKKQGVIIELTLESDFALIRPTESKSRIKQKLIEVLRHSHPKQDDLIELSLNYYHQVNLPSELKQIKPLLLTKKTTMRFINLKGMKFTIP